MTKGGCYLLSVWLLFRSIEINTCVENFFEQRFMSRVPTQRVYISRGERPWKVRETNISIWSLECWGAGVGLTGLLEVRWSWIREEAGGKYTQVAVDDPFKEGILQTASEIVGTQKQTNFLGDSKLGSGVWAPMRKPRPPPDGSLDALFANNSLSWLAISFPLVPGFSGFTLGKMTTQGNSSWEPSPMEASFVPSTVHSLPCLSVRNRPRLRAHHRRSGKELPAGCGE